MYPFGGPAMETSQPIRVGIVTVSDRASRGEYQDLGGPAIRDCLDDILSCPWEPVARVIPDERPLIEAARPVMEAMVEDATGVKVLSLHHDISTRTGEEVVLFTLVEPPLFRESKKK